MGILSSNSFLVGYRDAVRVAFPFSANEVPRAGSSHTHGWWQGCIHCGLQYYNRVARGWQRHTECLPRFHWGRLPHEKNFTFFAAAVVENDASSSGITELRIHVCTEASTHRIIDACQYRSSNLRSQSPWLWGR